MIKRAGILFIALLYTVTVMGVALNFHYCFNQVSAVNINAPVKNCLKTSAIKAKKCCKDQHLEIKVKDGHQAVANLVFSGSNFVADLPLIEYYHLAAALFTRTNNPVNYRGPPDLSASQPSIYLSNRNFRI